MSFLAGFNAKMPWTVPQTAGAGANYQVKVKAYYGAGDNGVAGVVYLNRSCNSNFSDLRPTLTDNSLIDYFLANVVDGVSCDVWMEVPQNLTNGVASGYFYCGCPSAASLSNAAATFVSAPISGVVGAWTLEEAAAEVNPTVIADDDQAAFWTVEGTRTTISNDTTQKQDGTNCLKLVTTAGVAENNGVTKNYASNQNWSTKSLVRIKIYGANTGETIRLNIYAPTFDNQFRYTITDNFTGWQTFVIPYGSFTTIAGAPSWTTVKALYIYKTSSTATSTWYVDRYVIDSGVVAVDSSGYGNHGAATGTTIVDSPFYTGKKARQFVNNDYILISDNPQLDFTTKATFVFYLKHSSTATLQHLAFRTGAYDFYTSIGGAATARQLGDSTVTCGFGNLGTTNKVLIATFDRVTANKIKTYLNGVASGLETNMTTDMTPTNSPLYLGIHSTLNDDFTGILAGYYMFNEVLTPTQIANFNGIIYPDVGLVAGSVCPRRYVYPEPTATFGQIVYRQNVGRRYSGPTPDDYKRQEKKIKLLQLLQQVLEID